MKTFKIRITHGLNAFDPFDTMNEGIDKTLAAIVQSMRPGFSFAQAAWKPQIDVYETADKIYIRADVAGVKKDEIKIEISPRAVRISGRRRGYPPAQNGRYRLAEIEYGSFERTVHLPWPVNENTAEATYKNGFLTIEMEKQPARVRHEIPIQCE